MIGGDGEVEIYQILPGSRITESTVFSLLHVVHFVKCLFKFVHHMSVSV